MGQGRLIIKGQWNKTMGSGPRDLGVEGQIKKIQYLGRHTTLKNWSFKNMRQAKDFIFDRMKNKIAGSGVYLNRQDKLAIQKESRKLVQTKGSNFTWEDRKDLLKLTDAVQEKSKEAVFERANNINKIARANQQPPLPQNKNIIFNKAFEPLRKPINNEMIGVRQPLLQQKKIEQLRQNIENKNKVLMPRQKAQLNHVAFNRNNVIDKQEENRREEKVYGFIDVAGEGVKIDDNAVNKEIEFGEELNKAA